MRNANPFLNGFAANLLDHVTARVFLKIIYLMGLSLVSPILRISAIEKRQFIRLPSKSSSLWIFIIAITIAFISTFQEKQKHLASLHQKQNLIEPANEMPMVFGTKLSGSLPRKRSGIIAEKSPSPAHGRKTAFLFQPIILQAAKRHGVDPALIRAIIMAESGYNPRAISGIGAQGLMQLMPKTAESLGVVDSFNPEHNIKAGVKYFKQLLNQFEGDVILALAAYNAGARKVRKHEGVPPIKATQRYIRKVVKYYQNYKVLMAGGNDG